MIVGSYAETMTTSINEIKPFRLELPFHVPYSWPERPLSPTRVCLLECSGPQLPSIIACVTSGGRCLQTPLRARVRCVFLVRQLPEAEQMVEAMPVQTFLTLSGHFPALRL
jgi:hypothetical protein